MKFPMRAIGLAFCVCILAGCASKQFPSNLKFTQHEEVPSKDSVLALAVANAFLEAWRKGDAATASGLLDFRDSGIDEQFTSDYIHGLSNPHHTAYSIENGIRQNNRSFDFTVRLHLTATTVDNPFEEMGTLKVILTDMGWRVARLPEDEAGQTIGY